MSKPDWKDAPEWANYLAQDADGTWQWFSKEPILSLVDDLSAEIWHPQFPCRFSLCDTESNACAESSGNWTETLERRP